MPDPDVLFALCRSNSGVIARRTALAAGISEDRIDHQIRAGRLVALHPGVYVSAGTPVDVALLRRAAVVAGAPCCWLSHRAAADVHGLVDRGCETIIEVTIPAELRRRLRGVIVHRSTHLPVDHLSSISGIPITSVPRTLADLGSVLGPLQLQRVVDRAVVSKRVSVEALYHLVDDHGCRGRTGVEALRRCLDEWSVGDRPPESMLELHTHRLSRSHGLPEPVLQHPVVVGGRIVARLDVAWPPQMVAVELDGLLWHGTPAAVIADADRQAILESLGWTVLRFSWHVVVRRPAFVAGQIRRALGL